MKISEIKDILKASVLTGHNELDRKIITAGSADMMEDIMSGVAKGSVLLTGLTTEQVIRTAKVAGVGAIVFVRGKKPEKTLWIWHDPTIYLFCQPNIPCLWQAADFI